MSQPNGGHHAPHSPLAVPSLQALHQRRQAQDLAAVCEMHWQGLTGYNDPRPADEPGAGHNFGRTGPTSGPKNRVPPAARGPLPARPRRGTTGRRDARPGCTRLCVPPLAGLLGGPDRSSTTQRYADYAPSAHEAAFIAAAFGDCKTTGVDTARASV